jgi:hypothetical protein
MCAAFRGHTNDATTLIIAGTDVSATDNAG